MSPSFFSKHEKLRNGSRDIKNCGKKAVLLRGTLMKVPNFETFCPSLPAQITFWKSFKLFLVIMSLRKFHQIPITTVSSRTVRSITAL